jgi:hypothetical protein
MDLLTLSHILWRRIGVVMTKKKKIGLFLSMTAGFFFSGYKTLLGAAASADVGSYSNSGKTLGQTNLNLLPQPVKSSLENQFEVLKQRFAQENLNQLILGVDEQGNLKIIGTRSQLMEMQKTIETLQEKVNVARGASPSSS